MAHEMEAEIRQVRDAIRAAEAKHATERAAADKVRDDVRESGVNIAADKEAFDKVDAAYRSADTLRDEVADLRAREARMLEIVGEKAVEKRDSSERREARTIGERYIRSAEYEALRSSKRLDSAQRLGDTDPVEVCTRDEAIEGFRMRTTVDNTAGSGGGLIWSDRREDLIVGVPVRKIRLLDLITVGGTDSDTVEWSKETTLTDAAAETAYGTNAPESAYGYTKQSDTVKRIPHFVPATKGALMDRAYLQTLLESRLVRGLNLRVESQALVGDATGQNLRGIYNVSGIGTVARGATTRFDITHKAITNVRLNLFDEPNAIGLHPTDFENLLLEKDANGNYVHGRAAAEGSIPTIWGLIPVVSAVFTQGTPLVGQYDQAMLLVRSGIQVSTSDSHSNFFIQGLVAILAEMRCAFIVPQPKAFCTITAF